MKPSGGVPTSTATASASSSSEMQVDKSSDEVVDEPAMKTRKLESGGKLLHVFFFF